MPQDECRPIDAAESEPSLASSLMQTQNVRERRGRYAGGDDLQATTTTTTEADLKECHTESQLYWNETAILEARGSQRPSANTAPVTIADGAFKEVLLLVSGAHAHAILDLFVAYAPHFHDVIFVQPKASSEDHLSSLAVHGITLHYCEGRANISKMETSVYDSSYLCIADIVKERLPEKTRDISIRGVFMVQSDFWLAPSFGQGLDLDSLLLPVTATNFKGGCNDKHWWLMNKLRVNATVALDEEFGDILPAFVAQCNCHSWVDAFYVPKGALITWTRAVHAIGRSTSDPTSPLINEHAIPLSFQVARAAGDCKGSGAGCAQKSIFDCFGSCCSSASAADIRKYICGHKLDWKMPSKAVEFVQMWRDAADTPVTKARP